MNSGALHIMQSNGGATFEIAKNTDQSGGIRPGRGVIGAAWGVISEPNVISFDVGSTTAKTSLVENGKPKITPVQN
jgi:N-methylhydantoinase A